MRVCYASLTAQSNCSLLALRCVRRSLWPKGLLSGLQQRTDGSIISVWCLPNVSGRRSVISALDAKAAPTVSSDDSAPKVAADTVLIVESKTKAKKIQKLLGPSFKVMESQGHVRDLARKAGSVNTADDFKMTWYIEEHAQVRLDRIRQELQQDGITRLVLATDPDREGEAIAWHLQDVLQDVLPGKRVERITFTEVTQKAFEKALASPRQIDSNLVDAYRARRVLDYLMGYNLSPILWHKVGGAKSAGRVQSPALRLLTEQEVKISAFQPDAWWTVDVTLTTPQGRPFKAELISVDGNRVKKFDVKAEDEANALGKRVSQAILQVTGVRSNQYNRGPSAPYMTSSMLTDAANQLGSDVKATMAAAQRLFEGDFDDELGSADGLISYIRTDSSSIKEEFGTDVRDAVTAIYGEEYLASEVLLYNRAKHKLAQEGHGGITPTDPMLIPADVFRLIEKVKGAVPSPNNLSRRQKKVYELIWRRTLASQMTDSVLKKVTVDISSADGSLRLKADAAQVLFPGFLKAFENFDTSTKAPGDTDEEGEPPEQEGEPPDEEVEAQMESQAQVAEKDRLARMLSDLKEGDRLGVAGVPPQQHFTRPPPRYSEASLVKALQELGIGRPSTYSTIISDLQAHGYAVKEGKYLKPTGRGKLVVAFLLAHFSKYLDYDYTSDMESQLDEVAGGVARYLKLLEEFWPEFDSAMQAATAVPVREVVDELDATLGPLLFPRQDGQSEEDARACPACAKRGQQGRLGVKLARLNGGFIGCSCYPDCSYSQPLEDITKSIKSDQESDDELFPGMSEGPKVLGSHPQTGEEVLVRRGRYGAYLQLGNNRTASAVQAAPKPTASRRYGSKKKPAKSAAKARRVAIKYGDVEGLDLASALELLKWPVVLGDAPSGEAVLVARGKYGFYVLQGELRASLGKDTEPGDVDLEDALQLLAAKQEALSKKYGSRWTASEQSAAESGGATGSSSEVIMSDDELQSSGSSSKAPATRRAVSRATRAVGSGSTVKVKAKQELGKAISTDTATSTGREQPVGTAGTAAGIVRSKGESTKVKKGLRTGKTGAAAAATAKSGYRAFWKVQWKVLTSQKPGIKMVEANKEIAKMWRDMGAEDKEKYKC